MIDFKYDDTPFFDLIKEYNEKVLGKVRGRLKTYLDIANPVVGSKEESVYTRIYRNAMQNILDKANFSTEELKNINLNPVEDVNSGSIKALSRFFSSFADMPEEEYKQALKGFLAKDNNEALSQFVSEIIKDENIEKIVKIEPCENKQVYEELSKSMLIRIKEMLQSFINIENTNVKALESKSLISAGVERFLKSNDFETALKNNGFLGDGLPDVKYWADKARLLVYEGTVALDACKDGIEHGREYKLLKEIVFDENNFKTEANILPHVKDVLRDLKNLGTDAKDNAIVTGVGGLLRNTVREMLNNKAWKKIFVPMTIALVTITLLVQPFFGNIKNEYPESKTKGGK